MSIEKDFTLDSLSDEDFCVDDGLSTSGRKCSVVRKTRQSICAQNDQRNFEKDELQSEDETDKSRSDALWADFLGDIGTSGKTDPDNNGKLEDISSMDAKCFHSSIQVPKTVEFSVSNKKPLIDVSTSKFGATKRTLNKTGGGYVVNKVEKKKKISVLEKSQMDWKNFKSDEGLEERLRTHNKGKDGFLDRQDFLRRTDFRQFEIEKNLRRSSRPN
ncbi:craniofacial development protein 1 [Drosophila ficusphila]|uniref:craniofacial development protein 1 n=1 Tax=Drosophila ficusphila TaxID=30025 RepID=UPI0007E7A52F|nr:craniofacial development protein 1 [Drosophila ficusphila]